MLFQINLQQYATNVFSIVFCLSCNAVTFCDTEMHEIEQRGWLKVLLDLLAVDHWALLGEHPSYPLPTRFHLPA